MANLGKTLSLISFAVGLVISVLVLVQFSSVQKGMIDIVAKESSFQSFGDWDGNDEDAPSLSTMKVAAPPEGSEGHLAEIEIVEESAALGSVVEHDGTVAVVEEEPKGPVLPADPSLSQRFAYYWAVLKIKLLGEPKEGEIEMSCKNKSGGKVCTVTRG